MRSEARYCGGLCIHRRYSVSGWPVCRAKGDDADAESNAAAAVADALTGCEDAVADAHALADAGSD